MASTGRSRITAAFTCSLLADAPCLLLAGTECSNEISTENNVLNSMQDEYGAALEEREAGYSQLLEELRSLRRRCPSPKGHSTGPCAIVECHKAAHERNVGKVVSLSLLHTLCLNFALNCRQGVSQNLVKLGFSPKA